MKLNYLLILTIFISCKTHVSNNIENPNCIESPVGTSSIISTSNSIIDSNEWRFLSTGLIIQKDSLEKLQLIFKRIHYDSLGYTIDTNTLSYRFKKFENIKDYLNDSFSLCYLENRTKNKYHFRDSLILISLNDNGFEGISSIFVLLKLINDTQFQYLFTINRNFIEGIGHNFIDTVISNKSKTILVGRSFGGDGGDIWGSIWLGVWNNFSNLEIKYFKRWENGPEDLISNKYFFTITNNSSVIEIYQNGKNNTLNLINKINVSKL